jgi:hypothetical protein
MTTQLLIYETAVPVSNQRHAQWSVEVGADYAFSRHVNAVPLMAVEFMPAASEYAIVFAQEGENILPAAILGMRGQQNLYLSAENTWQARYIPAFVRRYPFVFSSSPDGQTFTLCIDEAFKGFNQEGRGQRLFGDDGKPSPYTDNVLNFLREYQAQFERTKAICRKLKDLNLLEPMQAQITMSTGERVSLTGFLGIDRKRIRTLSSENLAKLVANDDLETIYLHLYSMRNFDEVKNRFLSLRSAEAQAALPVAGPSEPEAAPPAAGGKGRTKPPAKG